MFLRQLFDADTWTYTYLVADESSKRALLIDPVRDQVDRDLKLIDELGFELVYALDTHVHADHVTGAGLLRERTGCKTVAGKLGPESADMRLGDGDRLELGKVEVEVIETPGHTDDSVTYRVGDHVFTGDALFVRGTGRTDFQNGDPEQLYESLTKKLFTLDDDVVVWPGHDYKGHTRSTIGEEKRLNPRAAGKSKAQFVEIMNALNLPEPKFIHQAVPANRELGLGEGPDEARGGFAEIDGAAAAQLPAGVRVIDVREPHEFEGELGHIPRAENIPMGQFPDAARAWDRKQPVLMVCRSGRRSRGVCEQLAAAGFQNVTNLRGGMLDYRERGRGEG
jgi:glyoxylase-like metal-dependent hydrolase (beta-lactamase superfamily II)/rhodanese-related sulfurtransferase